MTIDNLSTDQLPAHVRFELDQLELELIEGDITQKGYDKKKAKLLASYLSTIEEISSSLTMESDKSSAKNDDHSMNGLNCKSF